MWQPSDLISLRKLVAGRVDYALVFDRVAQEIARVHPELGQGFTQRGVAGGTTALHLIHQAATRVWKP